MTLESVVTESDSTRARVLVYHVDSIGSRLNTAPPPVVKFSERQHAILEATQIQLATPSYYRKYEESESNKGIRDEKEAQYEKRTDMETFRDESKLPALTGASDVSLKLAYAVDDFWMFCTSVKPPTDWELQEMRREFEYDCVTTIANPSEFAKELGAAFAAYSERSADHLNFQGKLLWQLRPPAVCVYHGPVVYSDDSAKEIEDLPKERQAAMIPFFKRTQFSNQREYRFTISINGGPGKPKVFLPI